MQVWISDFGGKPEDPQHWVTVQYASPFAGTTNTPGDTPNVKNKDNKFSTTEQSYGMWMVPPDINNTVLVMFVNGNPDLGFWFACVLNTINHHMIPNIPGAKREQYNERAIEDTFLATASKSLGFDVNLPTTENNRYADTPFGQRLIEPKPVHEYQAYRYIQQGLDRDPVRGPGSASSQRESPSAVFGISTPGRPIDDLKDDLKAQASGGRESNVGQFIYARKGGHVFYMDDGDPVTGEGQQIRLRTAEGHQILMDDKTGGFTIHNSEGSAWFEMAKSGQVSMYTSNGFNLRTSGNVNFHSDNDINFFAKNEIRMRSEKSMRMEAPMMGLTGIRELKLAGTDQLQLKSKSGPIILNADMYVDIESGGRVNINSKQNFYVNAGLTTPKVDNPRGITTYTHTDTLYRAGLGIWQVRPNAVKGTIVPILPTHEPWDRKSGEASNKDPNDAAPDVIYNINEETPNKPAYGESVDNTTLRPTNDIMRAVTENATAKGIPLPNNISDPAWLAQSAFGGVTSRIKGMSDLEYQQYLATMAYVEGARGGDGTPNWKAVGGGGGNYVGAFQAGAAFLATAGYIKMEYANNPSSFFDVGVKSGAVGGIAWTGKDEIRSLNDFLNSQSAQFNAKFINDSIWSNQLIKNGIYDPAATDPSTIAGSMMVAHLLGGGNASQILGGYGNPQTRDGFGTTWQSYYATGVNSMQSYLTRSTAALAVNIP